MKVNYTFYYDLGAKFEKQLALVCLYQVIFVPLQHVTATTALYYLLNILFCIHTNLFNLNSL